MTYVHRYGLQEKVIEQELMKKFREKKSNDARSIQIWSKTSLSIATCRVSKVQKLPLVLLFYCITVRLHRVNEVLRLCRAIIA
jgi:hypothetical protein